MLKRHYTLNTEPRYELQRSLTRGNVGGLFTDRSIDVGAIPISHLNMDGRPRELPIDSFAAAVFWIIQSGRDRSLAPPQLANKWSARWRRVRRADCTWGAIQAERGPIKALARFWRSESTVPTRSSVFRWFQRNELIFKLLCFTRLPPIKIILIAIKQKMIMQNQGLQPDRKKHPSAQH